MERIGGPARRKMTQAFSGAADCSDKEVVRIFLETGCELRITPLKSGLQVRLLYHSHPWLRSKDQAMECPIFHRLIPWQELLDPRLSSHAQISFIGSLPDYASSNQPAQYINGSEQTSLALGIADLRITLLRPDLKGLTVSFSRPDGTPIGSLAGIHPTKVSEQISDHARQANQRLSKLPLWKRIALEQASDIAPLLHLLGDTLVTGLSVLKSRTRKKTT
jgi:hypothetical protein